MRLLDAAREVFSEHSFQGATVREICRLAEANVAAVNYHFGSKDGLLAEALNFAPLAALQKANAKSSECPKDALAPVPARFHGDVAGRKESFLAMPDHGARTGRPDARAGQDRA